MDWMSNKLTIELHKCFENNEVLTVFLSNHEQESSNELIQ